MSRFVAWLALALSVVAIGVSVYSLRSGSDEHGRCGALSNGRVTCAGGKTPGKEFGVCAPDSSQGQVVGWECKKPS